MHSDTKHVIHRTLSDMQKIVDRPESQLSTEPRQHITDALTALKRGIEESVNMDASPRYRLGEIRLSTAMAIVHLGYAEKALTEEDKNLISRLIVGIRLIASELSDFVLEGTRQLPGPEAVEAERYDLEDIERQMRGEPRPKRTSERSIDTEEWEKLKKETRKGS